MLREYGSRSLMNPEGQLRIVQTVLGAGFGVGLSLTRTQAKGGKRKQRASNTPAKAVNEDIMKKYGKPMPK